MGESGGGGAGSAGRFKELRARTLDRWSGASKRGHSCRKAIVSLVRKAGGGGKRRGTFPEMKHCNVGALELADKSRFFRYHVGVGLHVVEKRSPKLGIKGGGGAQCATKEGIVILARGRTVRGFVRGGGEGKRLPQLFRRKDTPRQKRVEERGQSTTTYLKEDRCTKNLNNH